MSQQPPQRLTLDRVVEWHLEHIRHIEEERALLLGFYGAIISILLSKVFIEKMLHSSDIIIPIRVGSNILLLTHIPRHNV